MDSTCRLAHYVIDQDRIRNGKNTVEHVIAGKTRGRDLMEFTGAGLGLKSADHGT